MILILISIAVFVPVLRNRDVYLGFITLYSSFFIIIGILLYRKKLENNVKTIFMNYLEFHNSFSVLYK